ncbi:bis(5'-nucleosyl)-tetraphosphatase (symmetrical) YqeK [Clostridium fallax]|uniref:bis(5'-nucleosyl)-tetraphosphatase (symmetrical) n=1 Tax=Clostridium fallax TaxID=1533 RepID=A0A1M4VA25_9CLOT|nr:bis(5'-nucleosyl)-tetraphosphatase (symmetrical) YqeK [Clostridium fallax]SHE65727.1 putative HD superfamily hydrolase of NAD metabolism [Clostridium fallax]SQB05823.1 HD domain-containing protein [Clostridium fallax]
MWTLEEIDNYLKENLKENRYKHTLGVIETAKKLAIINNEDEKKAEIAALIHDCAKNFTIEKSLQILKEENIEVDEICKESPQLLHGIVGAIVGEKIFGIKDKGILNAVKYHTTGNINMTTLEKIIYIADYIEPSRDFEGIERLRELTFSDLNKGVLKGLENTIKFVIDCEQLIHPLTIEARNYMLLQEKNNK